MEKLGVSKANLKEELRAEYVSIQDKLATLEKLGAPRKDLEAELEAVKAKIEELG